jgi:asparagine synthase (glutamine-hydrolysing)
VRAFLAVSLDPGRTLPPAPQALSYLDTVGGVVVHEAADGWLAWTGPEQDDAVDNPAQGFTARLTRSVRGRTGDVTAKALATMLGDGSTIDGEGLAGILPPFAAAHRAGPGRPVVLCGDWLGMRQLYWSQGAGVAAVSTSALALAALTGAQLNPATVGMQSLLGHQVGTNTLFSGVTKLAPGSVAVLHDGEVHVRRYLGQTIQESPIPLSDVVDEMAGILREIHSNYVADHPRAVLQLTGGQDSRVLLCAIPAQARQGLPAMTLGVQGSADVRIAARLSALCGLDHHVHWLDEQPPVAAADAHRIALHAAIALDGMASPLALAPLVLAESALDQGHRFSGAGGETARGFYYPGQPHRGTTAPALVTRLAQWRLFINEAVDSDALDADFANGAKAHAMEQLQAEFAEYSRDWLRATDEFYLFNRVQRWAGAHGTPAAVQRFFVNPMLDRRFIELALATTPDEKRNSHLMGALVSRLDPKLASVPLDSGLVPAKLGRPGLATTMAVARVTARKAAGKIQQRLSRGRKAQLGAQELAALVVAHWRAEPGTVDPLRRSGLVNPAWLDELLDARRETRAATVAFLVNLLVASEVKTTTEVGR